MRLPLIRCCAAWTLTTMLLAASTRLGVAQTVPAGKFGATASHIRDGDTFDARGPGGATVTIRLYGVDAPESAQEYGQASKQFLAGLLTGKRLEVYPAGFERNNRLVARVTIGGEDASTALLRAGLAWHASDFSRDPVLAETERAARRTRAGLWESSNPIPPWVFRRPKRPPAAATKAASQTGPFRGNVQSLVFHAPGCVDYACKRCTRLFTTESAASAAGFRAHSRCVHR
jgi:micrococcal nuclease